MNTTPTALDNLLASVSLPVAPAAVPLTAAQFHGARHNPSRCFVLPVSPLTKKPYNYQLAAVETILTHKRVLLGFQPGMGKTLILQAVTAAVAAEGGKTLVVVPPSLRISPWAEDFAADFPGLSVAVIEGRKADAFPDVDVVIIGDSVMQYRTEDIIAFNPAAILVDEAHRYKSRTAKRSKAILQLADHFPESTVVMATGTVAYNNAADVYQPLRVANRVAAKAISGGESWTKFMQRWCEVQVIWTGSKQVMVAKGCTDPGELRSRLLKNVMVSVPREDVLDLPERTFAVRQLALNSAAREYRRVEKDFLAWVAATHGDDAHKRAAKAEAVVKMRWLWELDGLAKVAAAVEYVQALTDQGEQVVLMGWHTKVLLAVTQELRKQGITSTSVVGGMSAQAKADVVNRFQAGDVQVLVGQIEAAGTGLTLHASCNIVFLQLPWSPGSFGQASDRVYRIGQKRNITIHVLNGLGMVSEHLWDVLNAKAHVVDAINTGRASTIDPETVINEVLSKFGW
jgi:SWI/SNF-related matrix-associated actin-dependent regulator 1 of chromatin subfamily A